MAAEAPGCSLCVLPEATNPPHSLACAPLTQAAEALQLRPLADYCASRLGQLAPRVKVHRYADVVAANAQGELWLILDSMVLDVKVKA